MPRYTIQFYESRDGQCPVESWLDALTPSKRRAVAGALGEILEHEGPSVCGTIWGRWLGRGLFEFRIARPSAPELGGKLLLRVFCHAYGDKIVLLLGAYDKGRHDKASHQARQIAIARRRLEDFRRRRRDT